MKPYELDALTAVQVAELLGVTDRAVRKWIETKKLPQNSGEGIKTFKWKDVLCWHDAQIREEVGTSGTAQGVLGGAGVPVTDPGSSESYDDALARKTRAEADLKELQLAKARSQVADVAMVERIVSAGNMATQTQILAVPSRLATRLLGIEDYGSVVRILETEMRQLLTNLAKIDAIREACNLEAAGNEREQGISEYA